jgi:hypothetical protein
VLNPRLSTLQWAGPFLHWLMLAVLCVLPVIAAHVIYKLGSLPGAIARGARTSIHRRTPSHLLLDGRHHLGPVARRDSVGASLARQTGERLSNTDVDVLRASCGRSRNGSLISRAHCRTTADGNVWQASNRAPPAESALAVQRTRTGA